MPEPTQKTTPNLLPTPPMRDNVKPESPPKYTPLPTPPVQNRVEPAPPPETQQMQVGGGAKKEGVSILSPEGIVVLVWAFLLDISGVILNIIPGGGVLTALLGAITIGPWVWFRSGNLPFQEKMMRFFQRGMSVAAVETLSLGILPGWTILVILTLKK